MHLEQFYSFSIPVVYCNDPFFKQKKKSPTSQKKSSGEKKKLNFREPEELNIKLNIYDLVRLSSS
jgi:hypothetical protein